MKKRIDELDVIKAFGIIFIVAGHAAYPFTNFSGLFHVAIFFLVSGFTYNKHLSSIREICDFIYRKIKLLLIPYFVYNAFLSLIHNQLIDLKIYANSNYWNLKNILINIVKGILFRGDNDLIQGIWFIKVLFVVSIGYSIIDAIINKYLKRKEKLVHLIIAIISIAIGYFLRDYFSYSILRLFSYYYLYYLGVVLGKYKDKYISLNKAKHNCVLVLSLCSLLYTSTLGLNISLVKNVYVNPFTLTILSLLGFLFIYELAHYILKIKYLNNLILYIGKNSYIVLLLHCLSFKFITWIIMIIYNLEGNILSTIPTYTSVGGCWWLAYILIGVMIPILYNYLKDKLKDVYKN